MCRAVLSGVRSLSKSLTLVQRLSSQSAHQCKSTILQWIQNQAYPDVQDGGVLLTFLSLFLLNCPPPLSLSSLFWSRCFALFVLSCSFFLVLYPSGQILNQSAVGNVTPPLPASVHVFTLACFYFCPFCEVLGNWWSHFVTPVQPVDNLKDILTHYRMNAVVFKPGYISVFDRSENATAFFM